MSSFSSIRNKPGLEDIRLERFSPFSAEELLTKPFPLSPWLVEGIIPEQGITILSGQPGHGKSLILLHLSYCVLTATPLFGHFSTKEVPAILIVDEENSEPLLQDRLKLFGLTEQTETSRLFILSYAGFIASREYDVAELIEWCTERNVQVILLDSLIRISLGDENDAAAMSRVFLGLRQFCKAGITVVITHHHRKTKAGESGHVSQELRGSSDISAAVDAHLAVGKENNKLHFVQGKMRSAPEIPPFSATLDEQEGLLTISYSGENKGIDANFLAKTAVVTALELSGSLNHGDLISQVQELEQTIGQHVIRKAIEQLTGDGDIVESKGIKNARMFALKGGQDAA